ncbi:hypothetical protein CC86DRAFT_413571 [Ophiobolus disseminans]|uniref:Uncharacterized protein n=1 Tax=Ophiobolus disseminans TaxID=1469910 RepID=A0A6A6ZCS3_9PLEO|nr:hypothetical protein CC86DRAFT_413571 [Ophiobolus disseminans]
MDVENIEGNVETPLLGEELDSSTSLWEHDKGFVRIPAQIVRWLVLFIVQNIWMVMLSAIMIIAGILLAISVKQGDVPIYLLIVVAGSAIALAVVGRISQEST